MDNASRWLTNAQIAVSTGTSGNSSIPNYEHLALVSGGSDYFGNAGIAPLAAGQRQPRLGEALDYEPRIPLGILEPSERRPRIL